MGNRQTGATSSGASKRVSADDIVAQMLRLFDDRVYQPGDRLREQELADRFNVSRGPIREALRALQAKSLVTIEAMRGATVARLSDQDARDSVEISAVLFGLAAKRCAQNSEPPLDKMRSQLAQLEAQIDDGTTSRDFFLQTVRLGLSVMNAAQSAKLSAVLTDTRIGAPDIFGPLGFTTQELRKCSYNNWNSMIDAIAAHDGETAERLAQLVHLEALEAALKIVG